MTEKSIYEMDDDEIEVFNKENMEENRKDYEAFKKDLEQGICWLCKKEFTYCDLRYPCQHWLLLPDKLRKKHLKNLFAKYTYDQLEGFLRWYVNAHAHGRHINDLREEHDKNIARGITIKFNGIEWAMQFGKNCIEGKHGSVGPHYHMQIRKDGNIFHSFSDNHIKLSDYELWKLNIDLGKDPMIKRIDSVGAGIQDILDNFDKEELLARMKPTLENEEAQFHIQSLVVAEKGHTISGDEIADLIEESKRTGKPMHQLLKKLSNAKTTVIVTPGPAIPPAAKREKHRHNKRSSK